MFLLTDSIELHKRGASENTWCTCTVACVLKVAWATTSTPRWPYKTHAIYCPRSTTKPSVEAARPAPLRAYCCPRNLTINHP